MKLLTFFVLGIFFISKNTFAQYNQKEFLLKSISIADSTFKNYPPDKFFVVGLGRSNVAIDAALNKKLTKKDFAKYYSYIPIEGLSALRSLSKEEIHQFLKTILPSKEKLNGRKIVIQRVLWEGLTMAKTLNYFKDFLIEQDYPHTIHAHFITGILGAQSLEKELLFNSKLREKLKIRLLEDDNYRETIVGEIDNIQYRIQLTDILKTARLKPKKVKEFLKDSVFEDNQRYSDLKENLVRVQEGKSCLNIFQRWSLE